MKIGMSKRFMFIWITFFLLIFTSGCVEEGGPEAPSNKTPYNDSHSMQDDLYEVVQPTQELRIIAGDKEMVLEFMDIFYIQSKQVMANLTKANGENITYEFIGVDLETILNGLNVSSFQKIVFIGKDGYSISFEIDEFDFSNGIVAFYQDYNFIPEDEGGPLWLVLPGQPGSMWVKGLVTVALLPADAKIEDIIAPPEDFFTPSSEFFIQQIGKTPQIDSNEWEMEVAGKVENPYTLDYQEFLEFPKTSVVATLECIGNILGGDQIGNSNWTGVPLKYVLERAGVKEGAVDVVFYAKDGYSDSLPLEKALEEDTLLAFGMDGFFLPPDHGFPVRLVVPGIYGMKWVKWIEKIEVVDSDYKGYWEKQGWDDVALVKMDTKITNLENNDIVRQGKFTIKGYAFNPNGGISRVEISTDGGVSWNEADIIFSRDPRAWTLWEYKWETVEGKYTLMVRGIDSSGIYQTDMKKSSSYPAGAQGIQEVKVTVREN